MITLSGASLRGQGAVGQAASPSLYNEIKQFKLGGRSVRVENFVLERDRMRMTFSGDFYFAAPVEGRVYGAVFLGQGAIRAEAPGVFERESVRRFLKQDAVEATFTSAVLRFTDDTSDRLSSLPDGGAAPARAQELADRLETRLLRETGLNLSSRLLLSVLNQEKPGVFFAEFDGGNRGRFSALLDPQTRALGGAFTLNGGEKGVIFQYKGELYGNDIWMAFYGQQDFERGIASYSDAFDLVSIPNYRMNIDLRDPGAWLRMTANLQLTAIADGVKVIPMMLNDGLSEADNERKNKGLRVLSAQMKDGSPIPVIQEEWETGFALVLPGALMKGQSADVLLQLEGKDSMWSWNVRFHYPRSTTSWYPRHGYLSRSRYDMTYRHPKNLRVASVGHRVREGAAEGDAEVWETQWVVEEPVSFVTFAVGPFERHAEKVKVDGKEIPIEYHSVRGETQVISEDFILAEMDNGLRYFTNLFGAYPYGRLSAAFFPERYGQGFPTLLLLPVDGTADRYEFAFIAHESSHQWWGNIVGWRSYRDQWLSEGFAEYSGVLYTGLRAKAKDAQELIKEMRQELVSIPSTDRGAAKEKLHEIGPLILGHRLNTRVSNGAGQLMYSKGALVLRMLHHLFRDPETGDDKAFFDMMKDFVARHRNNVATTESFMAVASEHFVKTSLARRYKIENLNWFLFQWIYQTGLPSYHLDYSLERKPDGTAVLKGVVLQQNVPENWFMPLPIVAEFDGNRAGRTVIPAFGPKTPVELPLPAMPQRVRLDPDLWVLSEKTSEKSR